MNMIDNKFNQENTKILNMPTLKLKEKRYAILYKEHKWIVKTVDVECDEVVIKNVNHYKKFDKKINLKNYDKTL